MSDPIEIPIYIYGVDGNEDGRAHTKEFGALHNGIRALNADFPKDHLAIEWGWGWTGRFESPDEYLTQAQTKLGKRVMGEVAQATDFTVNPMALLASKSLRKLIFFNFADMFYYVSRDGKNSVRESVARQIVAGLAARMVDAQSRISLTFLGHSAGSIVAFDLLFYLFFSRESEAHTFLPEAKMPPGLKELRRMAQEGRLRVRRLFTFGSPISPLACRSTPVVKLLAAGGKLNPADYGLRVNPFGDQLEGPRWVNFWDRDDFISCPVEPLMQNEDGVVKDIYTDVGDSIIHTHDAYWESPVAHKAMAKAW